MNTNPGSFGAGYCKIKTARQKKRLQKEDAAKQLIRLHRLRETLQQQKSNLPLVPLETPYQKGWKRSYVLRQDVARSRYGAFYQTLLEQIDTVIYHHDKRFKTSKRKRLKKRETDITQSLREFYDWEWNSSRNKLTDAEKILFYPKEVLCKQSKKPVIKYVFAEPWRYVLKVKPHMITHSRMIDEVLEQEIQELDNYIEQHNLQHRISKLIDGHCYSPWRGRDNKKRYREVKPTYKILEQYLAE